MESRNNDHETPSVVEQNPDIELVGDLEDVTHGFVGFAHDSVDISLW
ncbi:hypothetical protein NKH77_48540 [Streptomyces sp. M19]